jgi:cytochrome c5
VKRFLKRSALIGVPLMLIGFCAFLYLIPPFFIASPESFSTPQNAAAPTTADIADPAERALAERGRYIVVTAGCIGCHAVPSAAGPVYDKYLAGGMRFQTHAGTFVSRNLTPDPETGLARRSDDEVKRVLRSGVMPDGRVTSYRTMPWGGFSSLTEEDLQAVVVYLRHLKPVKHFIPDAEAASPAVEAPVVEQVSPNTDYGAAPKEPR